MTRDFGIDVRRVLPPAAALLLGVRLLACSSADDGQTSTRAMASDAGDAPDSGGRGAVVSNSGGFATYAGGTGGAGGVPQGPCSYGGATSCTIGGSCDGTTAVAEVATCYGGEMCSPPVVTRTVCPENTACAEGVCVARSGPPTKTCSTIEDCGIAPSVCADSGLLMVFSDPACVDAACRWKQIIFTCGGACYPGTGECASAPARMTAGPTPPNPMVYDAQPDPAPGAPCSAAADCVPPGARCYVGSLQSFVNPACVAGKCAWEILLSQCLHGCNKATSACE